MVALGVTNTLLVGENNLDRILIDPSIINITPANLELSFTDFTEIRALVGDASGDGADVCDPYLEFLIGEFDILFLDPLLHSMNMHCILDCLEVTACWVFCCGPCGCASARISAGSIENVPEYAHCIFIESISKCHKICINSKKISSTTKYSGAICYVFGDPYSHAPYLQSHSSDKGVGIVGLAEVGSRTGYGLAARKSRGCRRWLLGAVVGSSLGAVLRSSFFNLQQN